MISQEDKIAINNAVQFLMRCNLTGSEAQAHVQAVAMLHRLLEESTQQND